MAAGRSSRYLMTSSKNPDRDGQDDDDGHDERDLISFSMEPRDVLTTLNRFRNANRRL